MKRKRSPKNVKANKSKVKVALEELWELYYDEDLPKKEKYDKFEKLFTKHYDLIENVRYADEPIDMFLNYLAIWGEDEFNEVQNV